MRASNRIITLDEIVEVCRLQGKVFEASRELSIPSAAHAKSLLVAGTSPVILFSREIGFDGVGVNAFVYRDPVYTGGTPETSIRNPNDINPQPVKSSLLVGATITDDGTESRMARYLFSSTSNQSAGVLVQTIATPQIVLPGATLMFDIVNRDTNSAQIATAAISWAEPDNIPGLVIENGVFVSYNGVAL